MSANPPPLPSHTLHKSACYPETISVRLQLSLSPSLHMYIKSLTLSLLITLPTFRPTPPHQPLLLQPHTQSNPTSPSYSSFSLPSLSLVSLLPASVYLSITDRKWDALVQRGQADGISVHYLTIYRTEGEHDEREKEEE